jgi:hypothetical protein
LPDLPEFGGTAKARVEVEASRSRRRAFPALASESAGELENRAGEIAFNEF